MISRTGLKVIAICTCKILFCQQRIFLFTEEFNLDFQNLYLFNIADDPYETTDLHTENPEMVQYLLNRLAEYNATSVPFCTFEQDAEGSNPDNNGGVWMPWIEL